MDEHVDDDEDNEVRQFSMGSTEKKRMSTRRSSAMDEGSEEQDR